MDKRSQNKKENKPDKFWRNILIIFSLFVFPLIIPPFLKNEVILGHDSQIHMVYLRSFTDALSAGQFPVRWIEWYAPGFNQPLFNFYQPLFYYLFQVPKLLGVSFTGSLNLTVLSLWILSGVFMYLFVKRHFGVLGGIVGASFYVFAPYHISNIFVRTAFPEFTALTFVPAIFWSIKAFKDEGKGIYLFLTSIFTSFLILSHSPTLLMFSPLIIGYLVWEGMGSQSSKVKSFYQVLSLVFGFGIASFFILPAFFEKQFVQYSFMKAGYYSYDIHFACFSQLFTPNWGYGMSLKGCTDGMSFQLGIAHWGIILTLLSFIFVNLIKLVKTKLNNHRSKIKDQRSNKNIESLNFSVFDVRTLFLSFTFLSLFMTLSVSKFIWDSFYYLSFVQYPWRFLSVAVFASSFLSGSLFLYLEKEKFKLALYAGLIFLVFISYNWYLKPQYGKGISEIFNASDFSEGKSIFQDGVPEIGYMPKWAYVNPGVTDFKDGNGARVKGEAEVKRIKNTPTNKEYKISAKTKARILFDTHYFPGWKVSLDGKEIEPIYDNMFGLIEVKTNPGEHGVVLSFSNTSIRSLSNKFSIFFLFTSFMLIFTGRINFFRRRKELSS